MRRDKLAVCQIRTVLRCPEYQRTYAPGIGWSPLVPQLKTDKPPSVLRLMYKFPSDGRNTEKSVKMRQIDRNRAGGRHVLKQLERFVPR